VKPVEEDVVIKAAAYDRHREAKKSEMIKWADGLVQKKDVVMEEA